MAPGRAAPAMLCATLLVSALLVPVLAGAPSAAASDGWSLLQPSSRPSGRASPAMAYDVRTGQVILFGGVTLLLRDIPGETWAFDASRNTWIDLAADPAPPGQFAPSMVYDSHADRIVLFGGGSYGRGWLNETWLYDPLANAWTNVTPSGSPPPRNTFGMAYDSSADRIVIFGGTGAGGIPLLFDTWIYDANTNTWTNVTRAGSPSARTGPAMTYDGAARRVLLYGGVGASGDLTDTWAFDTTARTWTDLNPAGTPDAVRNSAMVYDSRLDRAILFGGRCLASDGVGTTWSYDAAGNAWTRLSTPVTPPCLVQAGMAYESGADESVLFGGVGIGTPLLGGFSNDTWAFRYPAVPPGTSPPFDLVLFSLVILGIGIAVTMVVLAVWILREGSRRPPR